MMLGIRKLFPGTGRLSRSLAALGLLVAGAVTPVALIPGQAQAACYSTAYTVTMYYDDHLIGQEAAQYASTCDGDSEYRGHVYDMYTDGSCVSAYFWNPTKVRQARSCDTAGTYYTLWDAEGDSHVYWDLCTTYHCRYWTNQGGDDTMMYGF